MGGLHMAEPAPGMIRVIRMIDSFTEAVGRLIAWLMLPLVGAVTYEVVARYVFGAPTIWAFDMSYMLYSAIFMLGTSYALLKGAHIRTDMLWQNFSDRRKGWIDAIAYVVFFFPGLFMLFYFSIDDAIYAFELGERSEQTAWRPYLWPLKGMVPLAALLLMIQGVSELLKSCYAISTGRLLDKREAIEI